MARIKHRLEYWATKIGFALVRLMSDKMADSFGKFLGRMFSRILPYRKKIAIENLKHAFKDRYTDSEYNRIAVKTFENIGQTFIDLARFEKFTPNKLDEIVYCDNQAVFDKVQAEQRGAIISSAHFGNWEMAGAWVVSKGYPIDVVVKVQSNPLVDNLVTELRTKMKFGIIPVRTSTLRDILKSLRQNRFVVLAADQHDPSGNLILDFFGRKASIAKGPAVFAKKQNCPIIPAVMRRIEFNKFEIIASPAIYPQDSLGDDEDILRMTNEYLRVLENVISEYPDQWMWTHRRWKIR